MRPVRVAACAPRFQVCNRRSLSLWQATCTLKARFRRPTSTAARDDEWLEAYSHSFEVVDVDGKWSVEPMVADAVSAEENGGALSSWEATDADGGLWAVEAHEQGAAAAAGDESEPGASAVHTNAQSDGRSREHGGRKQGEKQGKKGRVVPDLGFDVEGVQRALQAFAASDLQEQVLEGDFSKHAVAKRVIALAVAKRLFW